MLNLNLEMYMNEYTNEEKRALEDCFKQIQHYVRETIISKNPARRVVEYQLTYNALTEGYLVIDCNKNQVYLKHGGHRVDLPCYFNERIRENEKEGFKYILCTAVIDHWLTIREELKEEFGDCQSVLDLCKSFSV